ncbi:unnamed protein product [Gadus morhua 'NCC']
MRFHIMADSHPPHSKAAARGGQSKLVPVLVMHATSLWSRVQSDHVTLPGRRGGQPSWHDGRGAHCSRTGVAAARASRAGAAVLSARLGRADVSRRPADPRRKTPFCLPFNRLKES